MSPFLLQCVTMENWIPILYAVSQEVWAVMMAYFRSPDGTGRPPDGAGRPQFPAKSEDDQKVSASCPRWALDSVSVYPDPCVTVSLEEPVSLCFAVAKAPL